MRVLFCTVPITSLFNIKHYTEPNLGATEMVGALKNAGVDTIHIDLNASLNSYRFNNEDINEQILSQRNFNVLTSKKHLKLFLKNPRKYPLIHQWATHLVRCIDSHITGTNIDALCFSVSKIMNEYYTSIAGFNVSIILRKYLKSINLNVPFYLGGKYVYTMLKQNSYLEDIENYVPFRLLPTYYITGEPHLVFHNFLEENFSKDIEYMQDRNANLLTRLIKRRKEVSKKVRIKPLNKYGDALYIPDLKPVNFLDAELKPDGNFFPELMLSCFPKLREVKPFNYYNYRFTGGCIFKCSYCTSGIESDKMWRKDSPKQVADCLESFYDSGIKYVRFFNDNINFKVSWLREFCNEVVKRNIKLKWSDSANLLVGNRDDFLAMGEAGCIKLWYGTETMSPRILREIRKERDIERIDDVLHWAHDAGIWNCANIILNFPHETEEEYEMVRDFIKKYYDSNILNAFQATILKVLHDAEMGRNPERFGITIHEDHHVARKLIYTEDNNATWEEIHARGERRLQHLGDPVNIFDPKVLPLFENDYLFFAMYEAYGGDKAIKKEIYTHLFENEELYSMFIERNFNVYMFEGNLYKQMYSKVLNEQSGN